MSASPNVMSALSSSAVLLEYRRRAPVDFAPRPATPPAAKNTSVLAEDELTESERYSARECSTPNIVLAPHAQTEMIHAENESIVEENELREVHTVDWDQVNYETERRTLGENIFGSCRDNERQRRPEFLSSVQALKNDASSWAPYVVPDRFGVRKSGNCFILLLKRCARKFYDVTSVSIRGDTASDADSEYLLQQDEEFALTLPYVPFDYSHTIHCGLLLAIHDALAHRTNDISDAGDCGSVINLETLGFQGSDPSTDLRSTGIFGLVQLVYLIEYYEEFALRLWEMCTRGANGSDVYEELPFVLIGFNFSAFFLDGLKDHTLYADIIRRACNLRDAKTTCGQPFSKTDDERAVGREFPVLCACCEYYVGCLFLFWECWRRLKIQRGGKPPTIGDFGVVKAKLCARIKKNGAQFVFDACANARKFAVAAPLDAERAITS